MKIMHHISSFYEIKGHCETFPRNSLLKLNLRFSISLEIESVSGNLSLG